MALTFAPVICGGLSFAATHWPKSKCTVLRCKSVGIKVPPLKALVWAALRFSVDVIHAHVWFLPFVYECV